MRYAITGTALVFVLAAGGCSQAHSTMAEGRGVGVGGGANGDAGVDGGSAVADAGLDSEAPSGMDGTDWSEWLERGEAGEGAGDADNLWGWLSGLIRPLQGTEIPESSGGILASKEGEVEATSKVPSDPTYYEHVKPILDEKCAICHYSGGVAPMPLTTYEEVKPYAGLVALDVEQDIMPPWRAEGPLDVYVGDRRLTELQKATVLAWAKGALAEGDPADEPPAVEPEVSRTLEDVNLSLKIPEPYTPELEPDDYHCFVLEWPYETTRYVTALDVVPDNREIVHHAIAYYVQSGSVERVRALDEEDPGPGYECFGGVFGDAAWLTSYEPGGYASEVPGGLGFAIEPGSVMVLQMHYNTLAGKGPDQSRLDLKVEDEVERVGDVSLIMNPLWLAGQMSIPQNESNVTHSFVGNSLGLIDPNRRYEIFWVDLHMHALGSAGRIGILRDGERAEDLLNIPDWDFAWQETYVLREPVILEPGDQLYVECEFDNSPENQVVVGGKRLQSRDVNWGDGTTDEMCLGNVLISPVPE